MVDAGTMGRAEGRPFSHGLVVGKFYPPHRGHKYLIETANTQSVETTVILIWQKDEKISPYLRADWLRRIHPGLNITMAEYPEGLSPDDSDGWAKKTIEWLGGKTPDAVFTSEDYGDPYAKGLGAVHVLVDRNRVAIPISATMVRSEPLKYAEYLEPCVRGHFARRVAIVGAESTGKTTISRALAKHYGTVWVPEYGRFYSEGKFTGNSPWEAREFFGIARGQAILEDQLAEASNGLVVCDTDVLATAIWFERYMHTSSEQLMEAAKARKYDLYLVGGLDVPWTDDGTRDGNDEVRAFMHKKFLDYFKKNNMAYMVLEGSHEKRMEQATYMIDGWALRKKTDGV